MLCVFLQLKKAVFCYSPPPPGEVIVIHTTARQQPIPQINHRDESRGG